jgi:sterol desaturase/sphingolipid hydroxylase (fatty acid hydroxylase superfamily)
MGIVVAAMYPTIIVMEHLWPARTFPEVRFWNIWLGIALFSYMAVINVAVLELLPVEILSHYKLFDLSRIGLWPSIVVGYCLSTLVFYAWHRAEHRFGVLWRIFHQLHHAPRHINVYVSGVNHPFDLAINIAIPFSVGLFVLGVEPIAAVVMSNLGGIAAFLQHANIRTPRWLALFFQRPEAHCIHHQRGLHRYNYSDLPIWDALFGTFRNPLTWEGEAGFDEPADQRYAAMLAFVDVNASLIGNNSLGRSQQGSGSLDEQSH